MDNTKCDGCKFEEICEEDSIIVCDNCQDAELLLVDNRNEYYWNEMSWRQYTENILVWHYSEYSDGK
jgi:hypothetical protein